MSTTWMPLYVGDYLRDTGHLSTTEHGAYLLLTMHYWQKGGLPTEDEKLARIARMSPKAWAAVRATLKEFFSDEWRHGRIDKELARAQEKYEKRANAGREGGIAAAQRRQSSSNATSDAAAMRYQSQPQSQIPPTPAVDPDPGAAAGRGEAVSKSNYDRVEAACRGALAKHAPPDPVIGPVAMLEADGYDLAGEIIPAMLDGAMGSRKPIRTWKLLVDKARERIDGDRAAGRNREPARPASTERQIDFGGGFVWPETTVRKAVERWRADPQSWPPAIGPAPGKPGCRVPVDVFAPEPESEHV